MLNEPTVNVIWRGNLVTPFDTGQVCFFERLMYFFMRYRGILYLLICKLLFRLTTVVLLGCCEFNPNVRENSCLLTKHRATCHRGVMGGFWQLKVRMLRTDSANGEKWRERY